MRKTFHEFFAGVGLVREALEASGWECLYANDVDPKKQAMYEARFGPDHFHLGDVWDTNAVLAKAQGAPFLATASFPCTDLSLAGKGRGLDGPQSSAFHGFVKALGVIRPPLVLLENVPGLLASRGGDDFRTVVRSLNQLGYNVSYVTLDARHFVPQSRPRVFIAGSLDTSLDLDVPLPGLKVPDVSAFLDLDADQEWWAADAVRKHHDMMGPNHRAKVDRLIATGATFAGTAFRRTRHGEVRTEVRFDGLAGCLRTPSGGSARQIIVAIAAGWLRMRWMSAREYARLQGAPDFPLSPIEGHNLKAFGDAVCVPVVQWLDRHVLTPSWKNATG